MSIIYRIVARDAETISSASTLDPAMVKLLIALLVLVFVAIVAMGCLMLLRSVRRSRSQEADSLPLYDKSGAYCSKRSNHRRLTISAQPGASSRGHDSVYVIQEKQRLIANSSSPPPSPVPEIRITFPDEVDSTGKRHSGHVVVVRVGEHSVGLEPVHDKEDLPPYMRDEQRFQSLDLDRIGGLKEKEYA